MAQITTGVRKILEVPSIYSLFQKFVGSERARDIVIKEYIKPFNGMRILDVGCGPADILDSIKEDIFYYGFDLDPNYIEQAKKKFKNRGTFVCQSVTDFEFPTNLEKFDRIIITGVLHHLEDLEIEKLFACLTKILKPNGYFMATENTFVPDQSMLASIIISLDRGKNVRTPNGYMNLCKKYFNNTNFVVRHDLLRIPYTHIIIMCNN